jgi:hypothetical protein
VWRWLVIGEIKLPEHLQCGGLVDAQWIVDAAQGSQYYYTFDSYVKPGSPFDTPANRQTFNRNQRNLQDSLIRYARDPESGECAVVDAYTQWYQFTRSLHITGYALDIQRGGPGRTELTAGQRIQWNQFMQEFNGIMDGVLDPSIVKGPLEDWYGRLIHSEAYLAMYPAPEQVPTVGSIPSTGEGWRTVEITRRGLGDSFEAAQAQAEQGTKEILNRGATGVQTFVTPGN